MIASWIEIYETMLWRKWGDQFMLFGVSRFCKALVNVDTSEQAGFRVQKPILDNSVFG